ncbi:hypothetical protein ACOSP7_014379 [Xanthoceras sorbifolium]
MIFTDLSVRVPKRSYGHYLLVSQVIGARPASLRISREADLRFPSNPWDRISETAKNLVRGMLSTDPSQRLTAQQVLDHPWMMNDIRYSETRVEITFKIAKNVVITKNFYTTKFLLDSSSKYH